MIRTLSLAVLCLGILAACKSTPETGDGNAVDIRAALESIQTELNDASETGYDQYLVALRNKSADLVTLAAVGSDVKTDGATDLDRRKLATAITASALLADLPNAQTEVKTAIRASALNADKLEVICAGRTNADCELAGVYMDTVSSRIAATHALSIASRDDITGDTAIASFASFANALPEPMMDEAGNADPVRSGLMYQQACTLSWAHDLMLPKLPGTEIMTINESFASAMSSVFDETSVELCADGSNACDAAVACEEPDMACSRRKTSALLNDCGPTPAGLGNAINATPSAES